MDIVYTPIGTIHSPFHELSGMPIQPSSESSAQGWIELEAQFIEGLNDLEGFSHIILVYHLHKSSHFSLSVVPFLDSEPHGVFATRAPQRPNPIGISVVKLIRMDKNLLYVDKLDVLDGTPLLDIKPFIPEFDSPTDFKLGWLEFNQGKIQTTRSDTRFKD